MKRALALLGLLLMPLGASAFSDVSTGQESRRAIEYLQQTGVLQGYDDGLFRPAFPINRAELLKVLVAAKGADPLAEQYHDCFPDVTNEWFARYICYATQQGWVDGYPDGTFGPEKPVGFAEALKMLVNVRGYPLAPPEESKRRGVDSTAWFAPYLTTALLIDVVSFEQVWGTTAMPLQAPLTRGFVAQIIYRSLLAEGALRIPLAVSDCMFEPTAITVKTYVDVLLPAKTKIFRQEIRGVDDKDGSCLLATDANPFGRVAPAFDGYFLQPYPGGQPKDSWTSRVPLHNAKAVLRGGKLDGAFRPEMFVADLSAGQLRQLPSVFASPGGSLETADHQYIVFIGATGRTLEAINYSLGSHVVLDAVQAPLTFVSSKSGGQNVSLSSAMSNVVSYTVYDSSVGQNGGFLVLEVRTADLDAAFAPSAPAVTTEESSSSVAPAEPDPFDGFGETTPVLP